MPRPKKDKTEIQSNNDYNPEIHLEQLRKRNKELKQLCKLNEQNKQLEARIKSSMPVAVADKEQSRVLELKDPEASVSNVVQFK
jgi:hypothetical protein